MSGLLNQVEEENSGHPVQIKAEVMDFEENDIEHLSTTTNERPIASLKIEDAWTCNEEALPSDLEDTDDDVDERNETIADRDNPHGCPYCGRTDLVQRSKMLQHLVNSHKEVQSVVLADYMKAWGPGPRWREDHRQSANYARRNVSRKGKLQHIAANLFF